MARPLKDGIDYFPLDVDIDQDDKVALIEAQHGIVGFAVVIKLLMRIYKNSYYYEWTLREQLLFSKVVDVDIKVLNNIINDCVEWGLFDKKMLTEHKILTSRGIQKRYLIATSRRKQVEIEGSHLLLESDEIGAYSNVVIVNANDSLEGVNVDNNPNLPIENDDSSTQSKVKESKVKDIKDINVPADAEDEPPAEPQEEYRYLEDSTEYKAAVYLREQILVFNPKCKVPDGTVKALQSWADTIRLMFERDGRTKGEMREVIKYIFQEPQGDFWKPNIQSPTSLRKHWDQIYGQMLQSKQPKKAKPPGKPTPFNTAGQGRDWDFAELERLERERMKRQLDVIEGASGAS